MILICGLFFACLMGRSNDSPNTVTKNGMIVRWYYDTSRIYFEMSAPTTGWVTIGFNNSTNIVGSYLLMGCIENEKISVVEHYTLGVGNYRPITQLGADPKAIVLSGIEEANKTTIKFSLPLKASSPYQKDLNPGREYTMILAFSQEDDFQHHSIMRTTEVVRL